MADWQDFAACRGMGPALWFTERGESTREAKQVCATCPVRAPCFVAGLDEHWGIWGGTTERQRRRLRGWNDTREQPRRIHAAVTAVEAATRQAAGWDRGAA